MSLYKQAAAMVTRLRHSHNFS